MDDKSILLFVTLLNENGKKLCWTRDYKLGSAKYDDVFKAHKFDTPEAKGKRKHEFVTQYFPGTNKPPVDLAEEWDRTGRKTWDLEISILGNYYKKT